MYNNLPSYYNKILSSFTCLPTTLSTHRISYLENLTRILRFHKHNLHRRMVSRSRHFPQELVVYPFYGETHLRPVRDGGWGNREWVTRIHISPVSCPLSPIRFQAVVPEGEWFWLPDDGHYLWTERLSSLV